MFITLMAIASAVGCRPTAATDEIAVTIEPQRYFAEKIAGGKFAIHTAVPAGQSPEIYDPTPRQMVRISKSRAYLRIGHIGFEQAWIPSISEHNPDMHLFDLSEGFDFITGEDEDENEASGPHMHHPGGIDPHFWSSIAGARVIAANTLKAFVALDQDNEAHYRQNYGELLAEIDQTESLIRRKLSPLAGQAFIIYHPALTYFAAEFGLQQLCIETDGKEPSPAQLKELVDKAKACRAKVVFVQQEFDRKNVDRIAEETACRQVSINPLNYRWSEELIAIANALADE
jgi:zinc transport system substrate-binding protein